MLSMLKSLRALAAIIGGMSVMGICGVTLLLLLGSADYQEDFSLFFPRFFLPLIIVSGISFAAVYLMGKTINKHDITTRVEITSTVDQSRAKQNIVEKKNTLGPSKTSSPEQRRLAIEVAQNLEAMQRKKEEPSSVQPKPQTEMKNIQHMFSSLGLPREKMSLEERTIRRQKEMNESMQLGGASTMLILNWQDFARGQLPNSPLLVAWEGCANAIVRLDNMPRSEAQQMRSAVEQGRVLLVPVFAPCPTFTIFGPRFVIFDSPSNPFTVEDPRDITLADIQDFISAVLENGDGNIHLYWGKDAEPVASGMFSLCMNPRMARLPYRSTDVDREGFWQSLNKAANHFKGIPVARRNFDIAVKYYFEKTSL